MFNMESRHLLKLSVQNALGCILENFNLKNFPGVACARTPQKRAPFGVPMSAIAPILPLYTISLGPGPLSQVSPSASDWECETQVRETKGRGSFLGKTDLALCPIKNVPYVIRSQNKVNGYCSSALEQKFFCSRAVNVYYDAISKNRVGSFSMQIFRWMLRTDQRWRVQL